MASRVLARLCFLAFVPACGYPAPPQQAGAGAQSYSLASARADCIRCHQNAPFLQTKEAFCAPGVAALIESGAMPQGAPYDQSKKAAAKAFCASK